MRDAALDGLVDTLMNDSDQATKLNAARALSWIRSPKSAKPLLAALETADPALRNEILDALGEIGGQEVILALTVAARQETNSLIRSTAVLKLSSLDPEKAKEVVIGLLQDSRFVRDMKGDVFQQFFWAFDKLELKDRRVVPPLVWLLKNGARTDGLDRGIRNQAACRLGAVGGGEAATALMEALKDEPDEWLRSELVQALGRTKDPRAVEPLIGSLDDKSEVVRAMAAEALGGLGDPRAVEPLIEFVSSPKAWNRHRGIIALGEIGDRKATDTLCKIANEIPRGRDDWDCMGHRRWATQTLGKMGDPRAVPHLIRLLEDEDESVRAYAAVSLAQIGDARAVEPLVAMLATDEDHALEAFAVAGKKGGSESMRSRLVRELQRPDGKIRASAATALGKLRDKAAVQMLTAGLTENDPSLRYSCALALASIGDSQAVPSLVAALTDTNTTVRLGVIRALGELGALQAVTSLVDLTKNQDPETRIEAALSLGKLGQDQGFEFLLSAARQREKPARILAIEALGRLRDKRAVPSLIVLLKDGDGEVRRCAVESLGLIGDERAIRPVADLQHQEKEKAVRDSINRAMERFRWLWKLDIDKVLMDIVRGR
jgi:HEAT repeat protein